MVGRCCRVVIVCIGTVVSVGFFFFFQAEDGIRDLVRSRGLGDVYKRQPPSGWHRPRPENLTRSLGERGARARFRPIRLSGPCLLYTSDAADERSSVDLGGRRIIKKKKQSHYTAAETTNN